MAERAFKAADIFGTNVFGDDIMKERLPKSVYKSLKNTIDTGAPIDKKISDVVASAMKDWAIEHGATHYTHWFQPMTGITAEKHDAFIAPTHDGDVIMEFSGKELIKGEPDASSFPSGGLRATFEARGYTAWDCTSYAFVKDGTLYIPTAFCSYSGEALDKKTPLLRSMDAVDVQAKRLLKLFGVETQRVVTTVGPEQEYFLIDAENYKKRKDLIYAGRTLFGAKPPKGQEMEDHYFGSLKERISNYMREVDEVLWKLGVSAKTKHNEVAPAQHELACIYNTSNISTDHNQLVMDTLKKIAGHHGLVCLIHEKPFDGINGSGKHNNWSIATFEGENLLEPGRDPKNNDRFLLFLAAIIKAVDEYADLLRVTVATPGNDHRLGANEAPPAIISVFVGEQVESIIDSIENGSGIEEAGSHHLKIGASTLPSLRKDNTDRNRTSPFAFTGNKFEFRMPGSSASIADCNTVLNAIAAEAFAQFADTLEKAEDFSGAVKALIKKELVAHRRVIYNGNNYSSEWPEIAASRGLPNLKNTVEALPSYLEEKNIALLDKHGIFTPVEVKSRYEIYVEAYIKTINIEALTVLDIASKDIVPAVFAYQKDLAELIGVKKPLGVSVKAEESVLVKVAALSDELAGKIDILQKAVDGAEGEGIELAVYYRDRVFTGMAAVREVADKLELLVGEKYWPFPTYGDLLYKV
ncbi:MAG: glutamine synthetase III [Oscillospiraceae bacterium]|jgi:glutamine synthetase|nr:glutamine synthetase III [Oscillospiraceae bacterium]